MKDFNWMHHDIRIEAIKLALQENDHAIHDEEAKFRQFDVVNDCSDHYFANSKHAAYKRACFTSTGNGALYKKIMQDWRILEKDLPESIYVRVYAGRVDLLRAAIIGARETPYHDGLFFFDFAFPCDYPNRPPLVYYHSHGLRLNPNLYSGGAVCLSLLNTWFGTENEKWNPSVSTVLQVLVSLQGIVLNDKPYYNEPGFKLSGSWETYNEDAFLLSCKTMLFLLQNPPRNFEAFVVGHFCERANSILSACKAFQDGHVRVGLYRDENRPICMSEIQASDRFKKSMDKLYKDLLVGFAKNGASNLQNDLIEEFGDEIENIGLKQKRVIEKKKLGESCEIIVYLKSILGLNKGGKKLENNSNGIKMNTS
ncbi:putative ubiquitin-conjugating enzyme E2 38 isoform X1 [Juglans microcarpa x Juglans regia]|nr:putative ubiquitin-conjugating enzyme E2 38 isoform X1 [Juglans microcarpa x Juglans regia]